MTREEAINYAEAMKSKVQERIEFFRLGHTHAPEVYYSDLAFLSAAISALREQEERRWIPVAERLPKLIPCRAGTAYSEAVNVLTSDRKVITAIWDGTDWIGPFRFWDAEGEEITHWAPVLLPLPEPPKGE